jgi:hypothetical protein
VFPYWKYVSPTFIPEKVAWFSLPGMHGSPMPFGLVLVLVPPAGATVDEEHPKSIERPRSMQGKLRCEFMGAPTSYSILLSQRRPGRVEWSRSPQEQSIRRIVRFFDVFVGEPT